MHKPIQDLIVHIGLEKTGTTSIQSFLAMNHARLAEMGVFVPQSVGHENHKFLAAAAFRPGSDDVAVTSCGVGPSACDVATFRTDVLNAVLKEASAANATRALFSSEDLSRLFHADEIDTAMQMFETVASQVTILVFLRRQDLLATSRYYSLLLGGAQHAQILPSSDEDLPRY